MRVSSFVSLVVAGALLLVCASASRASAETAWFTLVTEDGRCLDVHEGNPRDGTKVQTWTCHGGPQQLWKWGDNGSLIDAEGKCLDADNGHLGDNGTAMQIWSCNGGANQQWRVEGNRIVNGGGRCLDVAERGKDGGKVHLWDCHGDVQQQWTLAWSRPMPTAESAAILARVQTLLAEVARLMELLGAGR